MRPLPGGLVSSMPSSGSALPESEVDLPRAIDFRNAVRTLLPQLSTEQRAVVQKAILDELSDAETAEALGLAVGTVKTRRRLALRTLRELGLPWLESQRRIA